MGYPFKWANNLDIRYFEMSYQKIF
jgi:hypothetical protein